MLFHVPQKTGGKRLDDRSMPTRLQNTALVMFKIFTYRE